MLLLLQLVETLNYFLLDEPTTALDFENKTNIIKIIKELQNTLNIKILLLHYDIESIKDIYEDTVIIKMVKSLNLVKLILFLNNPTHEYTKKTFRLKL